MMRILCEKCVNNKLNDLQFQDTSYLYLSVICNNKSKLRKVIANQ
jgi:hypothetical protein